MIENKVITRQLVDMWTNDGTLTQSLRQNFLNVADEEGISSIIACYIFNDKRETEYLIYKSNTNDINETCIYSGEYSVIEGGKLEIKVYAGDSREQDNSRISFLCDTYAACLITKIRADISYKDKILLDVDTGVLNYNGFKKFLTRLLTKDEYDRTKYAVLYMNIRGFKVINSIYGYEAGTRVIASFAKGIAETLQKDELFCRTGGDSFCAVVKNENLGRVIESLESYDVNTGSEIITVGTYVGVCRIEAEDKSFTDVMEKVLDAFSMAKTHKNMSAIFYSEEDRHRNLTMAELERSMKAALVHGDFIVYYQPKVFLNNNKLAGAEALIRWQYNGKILSPSEFIPLFEKNGFVCSTDFFVLEQVCKNIKRWQRQGKTPVRIAVNFSKQHLLNADTADKIIEMVNRYDVPFELIEIEFTETAYIAEYERLRDTINQLKSSRITTAIDDFGSGYSSLNLLTDLNFDVLKIDREFLLGEYFAERNKTIMKNVVNLADALNMEVVVEGVETKEQIQFISNINCKIGQGMFFGEPIPVDRFEQMLEQ